MGAAVLVFDYRGYGKSEGKPDEPGVLADARAARTWLAEKAGVAENRIVLMGESLGGAVAVDLAADGARALILENTFSSMPDVAAYHYPWLPVRLLMRTQFNSVAKIRSYHGPLYQSHGDRDSIVPLQLARRLFDAANEPKRFLLVEGADHNDRALAAILRQAAGVSRGGAVAVEVHRRRNCLSRTAGSRVSRWFTGSTSIPADSSAVTPRMGSQSSLPQRTVAPTMSPMNSIWATPISRASSLPSANS